jgi:hypothetical protein
MPVMLWGAMRFGYRFISLIWTPVLIAVIHFHYRYLPVYPSYNTQLAITSSSYLVFSFIVAYTAMLATQQRLIYARVRQMAFLDPVVHMPNLRALSRALNGTSWSTLCFCAFLSWNCWAATTAYCCAFSISKCWRTT